MKGKLFQSGAMALTLALASTVSLFSSCSSDDVVTQNSGKKELTISVSPSNSVGTRAGITSALVTSNPVRRIPSTILSSASLTGMAI